MSAPWTHRSAAIHVTPEELNRESTPLDRIAPLLVRKVKETYERRVANLPLDDAQKAAFPDIDPSALEPMEQFMNDPSAPGRLRWSMLQRGPLAHGTTTLLETLTALSGFTVSDVAADIRCPTLLTAAEGDMTSASTPTLFDAIGAETKRLERFTDAEGSGGHCEGMARSLLHQRMYDWLDEVLAPR